MIQYIGFMVARVGIEPTTRGFSIRRFVDYNLAKNRRNLPPGSPPDLRMYVKRRQRPLTFVEALDEALALGGAS